MKFTQEDKETIYNKYMDFIGSMCDDLDTFSQVSPKELVYAVLGLVEDSANSDVKRLKGLLGQARSLVNGASDEWHDSVKEVLGNG